MLTCPSCSHGNNDAAKFCEECGTKIEATPIHEERKVITALFCDLVGSTALGERLDAEDISRLLRDYQTICRKRIESHGGVIEKFIGDAVVGVFGVPFAHEDDPERAVRAALRIIEDIGASDLGIEIRIGVNTGEALVRLNVDPRSGEGFATGDTMNTAARLEAAAPVMGVAVGAGTYRASSEAIVYEELAPLTTKGKAEPVAEWRALHPVSRVGTDERDRTPFVGRDLELSILTELFDRSRSRPSTEFITIIAQPGLGKSRLVRELARYVDQLPEFVSWRAGRCLPYGDGISFWALGEIVKAQAGILETDEPPTISVKLRQVLTELDPQARAWVMDRLAPLVGLETGSEPPQQEEAFTAWRRFLEVIAGSGPTVLVVEDLHWADEAFVAFLEHLGERTAGLPLLVVVTARPEVEERHPNWPSGRRSKVLSLSPLTDGDVETLVTTSLPEADSELIRIVLDRAGGSPLYAEQLVAMLGERAPSIAGGAFDETVIPASVQALIAARIDALPREPKRVLMEASVIGKTFWSGAVSSLGEHPGLEDTLADLVRREFCRPVHPTTMEGDAEFSFWHALVRDVAYAQLTKTDRARMHAGVARWIADRTAGAMGEDAEIVIHHIDAALELAPAAAQLDTEPLFGLLAQALLAAGRALMRTDAAAGDRLLERALSFIDDGSPRYTEAVSLRGRSLLIAGRPADALPLLERAFEARRLAHEYDEAVPLARNLSVAYTRTGQTGEASRMMDGLEEELRGEPSRARAEHLGAMSGGAFTYGDQARAESLCAEGVWVCDVLGIPLPATLLNARGELRIMSGDVEGERDMREAVELLLDSGQPGIAADSLWNLGAFLRLWIGTAAAPIADETIQLCRDRGVGGVDGLLILRLLSSFEEGRWDEVSQAEGLAEQVREAGALEDESLARILTGSVEMERKGTLTEADRLIELSETWNPASWVTSLGSSLLARCMEPGVRQVGVSSLKALAEVERSATWRMSYEEVTSALVAGESELAHRLVPAQSERFDGHLTQAEAAAAQAAVAEVDEQLEEAASLYGASAAILERLGNEGITGPLVGLGRCLIVIGRIDEGRANLWDARAKCERLGAAVRVAEIDKLLASVGPASGGRA